jgi:hypothetical protein
VPIIGHQRLLEMDIITLDMSIIMTIKLTERMMLLAMKGLASVASGIEQVMIRSRDEVSRA